MAFAEADKETLTSVFQNINDPNTVYTYSAELVNHAYTVYSQDKYPNDNLSKHGPNADHVTLVKGLIAKTHPELSQINPVFMYEYTPSWAIPPYTSGTANQISKPKPDALGDSFTDASWVFMGFAAVYNGSLGSGINVLCFRGVQTIAESLAAGLRDISDLNDCKFPVGNPNAKTYGKADQRTWLWYSENPTYSWDLTQCTTNMGLATQAAVRAVGKYNPNGKWLCCAHSFGAAILPLAVMDCSIAGLMKGSGMAITFGGLSVGDSTFAKQYGLNTYVPITRFVNLCDWVPTFSSIWALSGGSKFVQLGSGWGFVWEKGDMWANHSMTHTYLPMLKKPEYMKLIGPVPSSVAPLPIA